MKKLMYSVIGLMILSIGIYSCSKDKPEDQLKLNCVKINEKHSENAQSLNTREVDWFKVVGADLGGGYTGLRAGAAIGSWVGQPHWGAGIGAVLVGGAASYSAAICCGGAGMNNNTQNRIQFMENFDNLPVASTNEFDYIGVRHNEILTELLLNYLQNGQVRNYNLFQKSTDEQYYYDNHFSDHTDYLDNIYQNGTTFQSVKNDISTYTGNDKVIVEQFINGLENVNREYNSVNSFITDYENLVNTNSSLTETEKANCLMTFSITRHSSNFWLNFSNI